MSEGYKYTGKRYIALVEGKNLRRAACLHALSRPEVGHLRAIAPKTPVCLVLSDHMLGGTTGTQLAADLKKVKPEVPVVLYSGRSPESLQNVDCFIAKSEPVPQFLAMIRDLVNRYWA